MDKKAEIRKIWCEAFNDTPDFVDLMFSKVYHDDEAMTLAADDGAVASSLLLQRYAFAYRGRVVDVGYMAGVATRRAYRNRGYMRRLLEEALFEARARGMAMVTLIPASRALYFLYDKLGFATVFYFEPQRFTALHQFETTDMAGNIETITPACDEAAFTKFNRIETKLIDTGILHSRQQFEAVVNDLQLDGGIMKLATRDDGEPVGLIVAVTTAGGDEVVVKLLLGIDEGVNERLLQSVREEFPDRQFLVMGRPPYASSQGIDAYGMARIVNPYPLFEALADSDKRLKVTVRLTDSLITDNNRVYVIDNGRCEERVAVDGIKPDLDVTVEVLTEIMFSCQAIGNIMGVPSARPLMRLMLD